MSPRAPASSLGPAGACGGRQPRGSRYDEVVPDNARGLGRWGLREQHRINRQRLCRNLEPLIRLRVLRYCLGRSEVDIRACVVPEVTRRALRRARARG